MPVKCGSNAECVNDYVNNRRMCQCKRGFYGDGYECQPTPCNEFSNCNANARCVFRSSNNYQCECNPGFIGDGYQCSTQTCDILNNCGENALCLPDSFTRQYRCKCSDGYAGNGYQCFKDGKRFFITFNTFQT